MEREEERKEDLTQKHAFECGRLGKNDIMCFRLFVLAFFSLFADQFLRFCPFNLSKSFFEIRMWPLVHWLPKSSFPVVGF